MRLLHLLLGSLTPEGRGRIWATAEVVKASYCCGGRVWHQAAGLHCQPPTRTSPVHARSVKRGFLQTAARAEGLGKVKAGRRQ